MLQQPSVQGQILAKTMQDPTFRQRLLGSPRAVLEAELGINLPADITIQIHEETTTTLHLVLPAPQQESSIQELSDEELERVAGGTGADLDPFADGSVHIGPLNNQGYAIGGHQ